MVLSNDSESATEATLSVKGITPQLLKHGAVTINEIETLRGSEWVKRRV